MLREVLGAPEDLPLEPVEHMSFAICSVIPSGVRCASARRLISEFMARALDLRENQISTVDCLLSARPSRPRPALDRR